CGWTPYFVEGDEPQAMHQLMAGTLDAAVEEIRRIQGNARAHGDTTRPRWPMIVLRSHQVPLLVDPEHPEHVQRLEQWMRSYKAEELFDEQGRLMAELAELAPKG